MKLPSFTALHHPHLKGVWVVRTTLLQQFIDRNEEVWEDYNVDSELFIREEVFIKDTPLEDILRDQLPEVFL